MTSATSSSKYLEYGLLTIGLSIVFTTIIIHSASLAPLFIVGAGLAGILIYLGIQIKGASFLFYFLLSISFLENNEGIQPTEIPFYVISVIMILYVVSELITGRIILETLLDKLFLFLLLLLPYAILLGIINGSSAYTAMGEATNYFGVLLYFPLRAHLPRKQFQHIIISIAILFVVFVLIRNIINYREIITQAVLSWQAEKARVTANEFILLLGCCMAMGAAAIAKSISKQITYSCIFVMLIGGLILTQSRGYWLAFLVGAFMIFLVINRRGKIRIIITFLVLASTSFIITILFFSDLLDTVVKGLVFRFQSIGSGNLDISLLERLLESKTILEMMVQNPISGYGMGYMYTKKVLFFKHFIETSYIHNGYLAAWFKFGLPGLITIITIWFLNIRYGIKLYRESDSIQHKTVALTIIGTVSGILLVNNTSPQVLTFESILFVSIFSAYLSTHQIKDK